MTAVDKDVDMGFQIRRPVYLPEWLHIGLPRQEIYKMYWQRHRNAARSFFVAAIIA